MSQPSEHVDLVALSLLPIWCWRRVGEQLRAGEPPGRILERVLARAPAATSRRPRRTRCDRGRRGARARAAPAASRSCRGATRRIRRRSPRSSIRRRCCGCAATSPRSRAPAVAIVGSRAGSPYGLRVAERLAADLAARGVVVVSGLARGVDSAAHRGALAAGGSTRGRARIRRRRHLSARARGARARRSRPTARSSASSCPARRRCRSSFRCATASSAACRAPCVVVEAGEKSGSLITARCALEQGRDVLAVPGNVLSGRNRGAHALLRDGAKIVESADDILEELGVPVPGAARRRRRALIGGRNDPVLAVPSSRRAVRSGRDCRANRACRRARLLPRLFELELQGLVQARGRRPVRPGLTDRARVEKSRTWQKHSSWSSRRRRRRPSTNISGATTRSSRRWVTSAICRRASWASTSTTTSPRRTSRSSRARRSSRS